MLGLGWFLSSIGFIIHLLVNTLSVVYSEGQIGLSLGSEGQSADPVFWMEFFSMISVPYLNHQAIIQTFGAP